jgi:hypothetical protein
VFLCAATVNFDFVITLKQLEIFIEPVGKFVFLLEQRLHKLWPIMKEFFKQGQQVLAFTI